MDFNQKDDEMRQFSYQEMEAICRDLQSKVSRNIIVQQELIEIKNELDQELNRFRLIEEFSSKAFLTKDINAFSELTVESFVQTFEQPHCLLYEYDAKNKILYLLDKFGFDDKYVPKAIVFDAATILRKDSFLLSQAKALNNHLSLLGLTDAIICPFFTANGVFSGFIICGQLKQDQYYFSPINPKNLSVYTIMAHKVGLLLENFRTNNKLKQEIEERKTIEQKLERQAQELARSNEDLQQFAYIVSHDLRAPLRNIKSFSQMLRKMYRDKLDGDGITFLDFITNGVSRFDNLINDLLQYSRVTRRAMIFEKVDLNDIIYDIVNDIYLLMSDKNVSISINHLPTIKAHPLQMEQLFQNIIDNAIKFKQDNINSEVIIEASYQDDFIQIAIKDNGIGIDEEYNERIFQLFQRLHTDKEYQGTGLGLSICKKIVERHAGNIWVESKGKNQGATFFILLPKDPEKILKSN